MFGPLSCTMFAAPTAPTSQPARVNGTQGAGVVFCPGVMRFGSGFAAGSTGSVQYLNALVNAGAPDFVKYPYAFVTVSPCRSG